MPYTLPTAAQFSAFFPELTAEPAEIDPYIERAALWVHPDLWDAMDYQPAILYLAAHYLMLGRAVQQSLTDVAGGAAGGGGGSGGSSSSSTGGTQTYVSEVSIGDRKVKYATMGGSKTSTSQRQGSGTTGAAGGLSDEFLTQSPYGVMYVQLRHRNIPAIAVV